jgi:hypothetical protein
VNRRGPSYLWGMTRSLLALFALLVLVSCEKEEEGPKVSPSISFRTDSGYTWTTDTVGLQDTVRVGVTVRKGTDDLEAFLVRVAYDGDETYETIDLIETSAADFAYEKQVVTRNEAGTENWVFGVQEADGDTYLRSVLLVVQ